MSLTTIQTRRKPKRKALRPAIDAFCKQCIYDPNGGAGAWRQQVEACTATTCPLYDVRPTSTNEEEAE